MNRIIHVKKAVLLALGVFLLTAFGAFQSFAYDSASLNSCTVENGASIVVSGTANRRGLSAGETADDGYYYLFKLLPYETGIESRTDYISWCNKSDTVSFTLPYDGQTSDSKLYARYVVALKVGNSYQAISNAIYVTNPGDVAKNTEEYPDAMSKKGLLIELEMLSDANELGVKHTIINFPMHYLLSDTGTIEYKFNGKTYHFNETAVAKYDKMISAYSAKGIVVTAILLNGWNDTHPELHMPGIQKTSSANYYGFNVSTAEGYETTRAILSFVAERYSGAHDAYGRISNWIVGNEVNNQTWNYVGAMDLASYTKTFERVFRVAYTAIKSQSKNARVFFSTDYMWKKTNTSTYYGARDFLDTFNAGIRSEGNIDWGLAYHPYPYPMTDANWWDDGATGQVIDSVDSPVVTLGNIHILTDYFSRQDQFKTASGEVRHIIFSEQGFTSYSQAKQGDDYELQAAAFAYAYYLVDSNPYIDAFIISRQVDAASEVATGCAFGIWTQDTSVTDRFAPLMPKNIYRVFKYIDTKQSLKYTEFAKKIIGISKWSDVITNFRLEE